MPPSNPSMDDYRDASGQVKWDAYQAAQVAAGTICLRCKQYIFPGLFSTPVYGPNSCSNCRSLTLDKGEVSSETFARCPKCRHCWDPFNNGFAPDEGEQEIQCPECEYEFELSVTVQYTFRSPGFLAKPEPEPEPEEEEETAP